MTARRGACPGLARPMQTGDGLLARFSVTRAVPLDTFAALCDAAQAHGNGIIEITSRGSIQVRGLTADSASAFAAPVEALDIADPTDGRVIASPLAGLDAREVSDVSNVADALRDALIDSGLAAALAPKVSVVIDGGGAISLDTVPADIRLRAESVRDGIVFHVSLAEMPYATIAPEHAVTTIITLLQTIAARGVTARARDTLPPSPGGGGSAAVAERRRPGWGGPIGAHELRDDTMALGLGLAFGHSDARTLQMLIEKAERLGARAARPAPGRALLVIGVAPEQTNALTQAAQRLGFIINADDPRRRVIACAGAPVCAQARIPARTLAPAIVDSARPLLQRGATIHISGCAKGCAHPRSAALTVVGIHGRCGIVRDGTARDAPREMIEPNDLPAHLTALLEPAHG